MTEALIAVAALVFGFAVAWVLAKRPEPALRAERDEARKEADERRTRLAETAVEIRALQTQIAEREQSMPGNWTR